MRLKLFGIALAAAVFFSGFANAAHQSQKRMFVLNEGKTVAVLKSSYCDEASALSVILALGQNGIDASIVLYEEFLKQGTCVNISDLVWITPIRLVYQFGDALVVEVILNGKTTFFISPNSRFVEKGSNS